MTMKSLLVTLGILGSSSVALADHGDRAARFSRRDDVAVRYRDLDRDLDRDRARLRAVPRASSWQALTRVEQLDRGGDVFDVRARGRFAQLRLQNQTGRTFVRAIEIEFADGSRQRVPVQQTLDGNHAMVNIDLDGGARRIDRIIVDGRSSRGGSFQLYAM